MSPPPTISVIVNPSAGKGRARRSLPAVLAELTRLGVPHHAQLTRDLDHARELARRAAADGEVAAALGGDGLVAAVAGALAGGDGVLAVLPGGRGNDFARSLGLPGDPVAACRPLAAGHTRRIDLGSVRPLGDGVQARTFVGIAISGLDAETNRLANETKLQIGRLVYIYSALRVLASWRPVQFELKLDGEPLSVSGYAVSIANSSTYGGGMQLAPNAALDDGQFDVVLVSDVAKLRLLAWLPRIFFARHLDAQFIRVLRASEVEIAADRHCMMYADGDPLMQLPVAVSVLPLALDVVVPQ